MRKAFKRLRTTLVIVLLLAAVLFWVKRPRTPKIRGTEAVAALEKVTLGGIPQWILIRGEDRTAPVLLFLHGGPGMPMMYLAHTFQRRLEDRFVCVQWDQRGAGKSFNHNIPEESLSVEQILADALELIGLLRELFHQERIYLAGHSWGSYLGMLLVHRHPEFFRAFIGIGQVVDEARGQEITERFIREQAIQRNDQEALLELNTQGHAAHEKWLFKFGGALYGKTGYASFIWAGIRAPEYGLFDIRKVAQGSSFSSRHMQYDAIAGPLIDHVTAVRIPVYFFAGRHDFITPSELVAEYFRALEAPRKRVVWFERSAHFPFYSEPERFAREVKSLLGDVPQGTTPHP